MTKILPGTRNQGFGQRVKEASLLPAFASNEVQTSASSLSGIRFAMPSARLQPTRRVGAEGVTRLGFRSRRWLGSAAFLLSVAGLSAQQASYDSNWDPEWDQVSPSSSSSSVGSYATPSSSSSSYSSPGYSNSGSSHYSVRVGSRSSSTSGTASLRTAPESNTSTRHAPATTHTSGSSQRDSSRNSDYRRRTYDDYRTRCPGRDPTCPPRNLGLPIFLAGRVALANGEGPHEPVRIVVSCGGRAIPQVYTNSKGRFNFQPECRPLLALADASISGYWPYPVIPQGLTTRNGTANLMGCVLYAELSGHWSTRVRLGRVTAPRPNDVGLIVLQPLRGSTGRSVSRTTLAAPPKAKRAYRNGITALRKTQSFGKAAKSFKRAVEIHPEHAQAWAGLGEALAALGDFDEAQKAFERSIEADPNLLQPYDAMMPIAFDQRDWEQLDTLAAKYLKLAPGSSRVRFYSSVAALNLDDLSRTEFIIKQMEELGETDEWPMSHVIMAIVHERRADFEAAADYYEKYIKISVDAEISRMARRTIYDWGHLQVIEPRPVTLAQPAAL